MLKEFKKTIIDNKGFALISSLSIMILLVMITVGTLTLATSEIRKSSKKKYQLEAQANARMALAIAIGKLQKYASQDQRITATAAILDKDPETENIDDVVHPHWVGVWRSDGLKNEAVDTGLIQQESGPVTDRRVNNYNRETEALKWLVSGEALSPKQVINTSNSIMMFKPTSSAATSDRVIVEKVKVKDDGHYAFWVADEGVKAKVNLKKEDNKKTQFSNAESYRKLLSPNTSNLGALYSNYDALHNEDFEKIIDINQIPLAPLGSPTNGNDLKKSVQHYSHDLTTSSASVLSDTLKGGLKKNLTAYINSNGQVPPLGNQQGISDSVPIIQDVGERDTITPKFGAIRDWVSLRDKTTNTTGNRSINMTYVSSSSDASYKNPSAPDQPVEERHAEGIDMANYTNQAIQPILLDASYQLNYAYDASSRELYELIYPRAVIWNPYNVKLKTPKLYITMNFDCDLSAYRVEHNGGTTPVGINYQFNRRESHGMHFMIPSMTFEPGECLHFTASNSNVDLHSKATRFAVNPEPIDRNKLSATTDPSDLFCFYRKVRTPPIGRGPIGDILKLPATVDMTRLIFKTIGTPVLWTQAVYMYADKANGSPKYNDLGSINFPVIQRVDLNNYARVNGSIGRWSPRYNPSGHLREISDILSSNVPPDTIRGFGMRWKNFSESASNKAYGNALNEPWYSAPLIHNNVRAQNIHRWPTDNLFGMAYTAPGVSTNISGALSNLYSYGPLSQTREFPQWNSIVNSVELDSQTGNYRTGPFFGASGSSSGVSVYPLFDIPDKDLTLHSLGSFQHVQFTSQVWHPSYIIGNGFASPYLATDSTSLSNQEEEKTWSKVLNPLTGNKLRATYRKYQAGNNPYIYDISYETNLHLWDKYFLSSLEHQSQANGWGNGSWNKNEPLPNSRMIISDREKDSHSYTKLTDFHKAAQSLMISGGFNVNSTSVRAWEALLRSFNGLEIESREGSTTTANPFSRFITPQAGGNSPADATDNGLWDGYRDLSDEEINSLAQKMVIQVKKRAPFISLSDFVNRRLGELNGNDDELKIFGTIQAAINETTINSNLDSTQASDFVLPSVTEAKKFNFTPIPNWKYIAAEPQIYEPFQYTSSGSSQVNRISKAAGASSYLSQGDVLQQIGSVLTARSDSFKIRCYGDATDSTGKIMASAWCEANIQRIPEPITPDSASSGLNPLKEKTTDLGRKFIITSFRWINPNEADL